jgi:hypothetical protein
MERALRNPSSGLGPWEATCTQAERNMIGTDDLPVFNGSCGDCGSGFSHTMSWSSEAAAGGSASNSSASVLQVEARFSQVECSAQDVWVQPASVVDGLVTDGPVLGPFPLQSGNSRFTLAPGQLQGFTVLRFILRQGTEELWRSGHPNPSPPIPAAPQPAGIPAESDVVLP